MIGHTLAHYRIQSKLGAGGMGVVYQAWDTHLDRLVAIKVLPSERRADPEGERRFVLEAKAASALNHPNILQIYDIDTADGVTFIVMEYIPGKTLDAVIGAEGLSVTETLNYAVQIADALAAAHAAGIIHRDIKPSNIIVRENQQVKILDFGLAKLTDPGAVDGAVSTRTAPPATAEGLVVGTLAYMSPEQAEGRKIDARSDIFSFGSVLYEMASGRRPFVGASTIPLLHAVAHGEPRPLSDVRAGVPPELRMIVEKALEKDPADRYQSTRDLVVDLKRAQRSIAVSAAGPAAAAQRSVRQIGPWIVAALAVLLAVVAGALWRLPPTAPDWTNLLASAQFRRVTDFEGSEFDAVLSPDGNFVAFLSDRGGTVDLWVSQIGSGQFSNLTRGRWRLLNLPTTVQTLAFSPEGTHVGLNISGATALVPIMGGPPRPLIDPGIEAVWSPDGRHLAYHELTPGDPLFVADADGSNRKELLKGDPGQHCHHLSWSPDGQYLYFARGAVTSGEMDIWRMPTAGGEPERLTFHNARTSHPLALDSGRLLYISTDPNAARTVLYAMEMRRRVTRPINLGVREYLSIAGSADRRRLVVTEANPSGNLWTIPLSEGVSGEDTVARFELPSASALAPRFGRGYVLYLSSTGGANGLWKLEQGVATELWKGERGGVVAAPASSPDGRWIAFCPRREGRTRLYRIATSGANPTLLSPSLDVRDVPSWSPDGRWIVVSGNDGTGPGLFKVPADGGTPVRLLNGLHFHPLWSPDGQFIVYAEDVGGGILRVKAITPESNPVAFPELEVSYVWDAYRFLNGSKALLVLQGGIEGLPQNFWALDVPSGRRRQVTSLRSTGVIHSFDVSADGTSILFDRTRANADVVLIDRPER